MGRSGALSAVVMAKPTLDGKVRLIGQSRDRTGDLRIFSPSLYQLSYLSAPLGACEIL